MPFDPNVPQAGQPLDATVVRNQLNALHDRITGAFTALDWSNGAPKLPEYTTIAVPVLGNIAFNYSSGHLMVFDGADWQMLGA
jgi:hypothetical protein